jgi:hypothetical protein
MRSEPKQQRLNPNYFKSTPSKVTEENKCFWSHEVEVGGSICKKCWNKFSNRARDQMRRGNILANDSKVCV